MPTNSRKKWTKSPWCQLLSINNLMGLLANPDLVSRETVPVPCQHLHPQYGIMETAVYGPAYNLFIVVSLYSPSNCKKDKKGIRVKDK